MWYYQFESKVGVMVKAKVGDTIIINRDGLIVRRGKEYTVVELPCKFKGTDDDKPEHVWVVHKGDYCWLLPEHYKIAKQTISHLASCQDCRGTGEIQLFTSVRKCGCRNAIN